MTAAESKSERLIADYLREIRVSAWIRQLPARQTDALEAQVSHDIQASLEEAGKRDDATVYGILDRLGAPGEIVARATAQPRSGSQQAVDAALAPVLRVRDVFRARGWGLAEIGALVLLTIGPFFLWWMGPIFGIILTRVAADRWTHRATHRATVVVASLFAIQALVAVLLFALIVIEGGSAADQLQWIVFDRRGLTPGFGGGSLSPAEMLLVSPAFLAGIGSGLYLAFSPRHRP